LSKRSRRPNRAHTHEFTHFPVSRAQWTETINSLEQDSLQAEGLARAMALLPFAMTRETSELDADTTPEESVVNGSFDNQSPQQRLGSGQVGGQCPSAHPPQYRRNY
jgi:hypothetical protein